MYLRGAKYFLSRTNFCDGFVRENETTSTLSINNTLHSFDYFRFTRVCRRLFAREEFGIDSVSPISECDETGSFGVALTPLIAIGRRTAFI